LEGLSTFLSSCKIFARITESHFWAWYYCIVFCSWDIHLLFLPPTLLIAVGKEYRSKQGLDFKSVTETISVHTHPRHLPSHNTPLVLSTHNKPEAPLLSVACHSSYSTLLQIGIHDDLEVNPKSPLVSPSSRVVSCQRVFSRAQHVKQRAVNNLVKFHRHVVIMNKRTGTNQTHTHKQEKKNEATHII
jgi:hypothetical protein